MTNLNKIQSACNRIVGHFHPEKIILFGSYAQGTPSEDSDVDLLIVMRNIKNEINKAVEIRMAADLDFPSDILVRTPEKIQSRIEMGDFFMKNITTHGKTLYEANYG